MTDLENKYQVLLKEREQLLRDIADIKEKEAFASAKARGHMHRKLLLRRLPVAWVNSVFCTQRENILPLITYTFDNVNINNIVININTFHLPYETHYFAMLCKNVVMTDKGIVLELEDPYRKISTYPLQRIDLETAQSFIGRIVVVKLQITRDAAINKVFRVEGIKLLKYTCKGVLINNVEKIIEAPMYPSIKFLENLHKYDECIYALNSVEQYFRNNDFFTSRQDEKRLHIQNDENKFSLAVLGDNIFYIADDAEKMPEIQKEIYRNYKDMLVLNPDYGDLLYYY